MDSEPKEQNKWVTANDLLENNQRDKIFTSNDQFQLYSIMVRKIDFVKSERLLQSYPYILLNQDWVEKLRKKTLALAERAYYYFKDTSVNYSIRLWQKKIIKYLEEQKRMPFPLFRLVEKWETFFLGKQYIPFQSARGENFYIPLYLTRELAYVTGVLMGDGHLAKYALYIVDYHEGYIKQIGEKISHLFGADILYYPHKQCNAFMLCQKGKWLVRLINFLSGQPIARKKYSSMGVPLLFKKNKQLLIHFWQGLMDTDGSYSRNITFCSSVKSFVEEFRTFLQQENISTRPFTINSKTGIGYGFRLLAKNRHKFYSLIQGSQHPEKREQLKNLLNRTTGRRGRPTKDGSANTSWQKFTVTGINYQKCLLANSNYYFDFSYLPRLTIEAPPSIQQVLSSFSLTELSTLFEMSPARLRYYTKGTANIPLFLVEKVLSLDSESPKLSLFLATEEIQKFFSNKSSAILPLQPSQTLTDLIVRTIMRGNAIISTPNLSELASFFGVRHKNGRIVNAILLRFLKTFSLLELIDRLNS